MKVNKKYLLLIILSIFTFSIKNVYAIDLYDAVTNNTDNEIVDYEINDDTNEEIIDNKEYSYINEETHYKAIIDDRANLLSNEEKGKLFEEMKPLTKYGHIGFVSTNENSYYSVNSFSENYYHSTFSTESGSIFVIDMSNRKIYIFSDGANYRVVNSSKAYSITDNTYTYATKGDYYGCASVAYKQMLTILEGGKIAEPMRYTSNLFISLTLALFFSFLYVLSKTKINKASTRSITNNCDIEFEIGETSAIKTGQHRVYSPQSSGSSGGGGGGGGGGSSGGGGGHSF